MEEGAEINYYEHENFHIYGFQWGIVTTKRLYTLLDQRLSNWSPTTNDDIKMMIKAIRILHQVTLAHGKGETKRAWSFIKEYDTKGNALDIIKHLDQQRETYERVSDELEQEILTPLETTDINDLKDLNKITLYKSFNRVKSILISRFQDQEKLILPIVVSSPKEVQLALGRKLDNDLKKDPHCKFCISAVIDCAKYDPSIAKTFSKQTPFFARKLFKAVYSKKSYSWFLKVIEV